ncbi:hypothetical protein M3Y96_00721200 [Aphelenchoides besseyi]|nr:hypothetical protein M3Y96_00721200 [Aphelenchoides besseyi]
MTTFLDDHSKTKTPKSTNEQLGFACIYLSHAQEINQTIDEVSMKSICSEEFEIFRSEDYQPNVFVGCQVQNLQFSNQTANQLLETFYCDGEKENSTHITFELTNEVDFHRWTLLCLIVRNETVEEIFVSYTLTIDWFGEITHLFVERNFIPELQLAKVPIYKAFPYINLRLPSDFFYPFSCRGLTTWKPDFNLFVLLFVFQLFVKFYS